MENTAIQELKSLMKKFKHCEPDVMIRLIESAMGSLESLEEKHIIKAHLAGNINSQDFKMRFELAFKYYNSLKN